MLTRLILRNGKTRTFPSLRLTSTAAPAIRQPDNETLKRSPLFKPGDRTNGFVCSEVQYIPDFNFTAYRFRHEKTGLDYMHVDRQDSNNTFSINFRTTPFNSTGLPHILEHSVLCGSQRYPVRDPFFKMLNRSLQTFMNAMTGPDYTLYPFSTTNEVDYRNLQGVYLDAVFRPNLKYLDFLQEGWRLEHSKLEDRNSPLEFKGVVYNEMKGAFSENASVFGEKFFNTILPDHTYGYVSGGDPLEIPNLTHKDLVAFHQRYYHPSNARIYSYGNFPLEKTMRFVNEEYLSQVDGIDSSYSRVPSQPRWSKAKGEHITCRFDNMGAPFEKQNQIGIGFLMSDITDIYETFVLHVLTALLVKGPNSCFYKSLIEPNISGGYNSMTGFESQIKDTMFVLGLQDLAVADFEKVQRIFDETLDQVIENGFDPQHVESVLHSIELAMKHQTTKFGLGMIFNLTPLWNHDGNLIEAMFVSKTTERFRRSLAEDPKYLEKKVEQYFRGNRHRLTLTMSPDLEHERKFSEAEMANLEAKETKLTPEDRDRVYKEGLALAEAQKSTENMELLPCLQLKDIKKSVDPIDLERQTINCVPTQVVTVDTNGVNYFRAIFDASALSEEEQRLIPLLNTVIDQFGTSKLNYRDFDKLVQSKTAGISFSTHLTENPHDSRKYELGVRVNSYCLAENTSKMFELIAELLTDFKLDDVSRFEMLLENYISNLSVGIAQSGHLYAMQSCNALVSEVARLRDSLSGLDHLNYMKRLVEEQTPDQILQNVRSVAEKLLKNARLRAALNVSADDKPTLLEHFSTFLDTIRPQECQPTWNQAALLPASNQHNLMTIPVNYCAKSIVAVPYSHPDFAPLLVTARLLSSKFLLPEVREKNGAYGAGARLSIEGIFAFFSYRDPNNVRTLDTFDAAAEWIRNASIDDQTLFEAKLGILQNLDAPIAPVDLGAEEFVYGIDRAMFAENRKRVLDVTADQIKAVSERYLALGAVKNVGKCVLGPECEQLGKEWNVKK